MTAILATPIETTVFEAELAAVREKPQTPRLAPVNENAAATTSMHGGVFKVFAALNAAILGVFWWTFRSDAEALFMVAISGVYLAAYLGTPFIMSRVGRVDTPQHKPFHQFLEEPFETWTGVITGREAMLQVLLIPGAIFITVIGISIIIQAVQ